MFNSNIVSFIVNDNKLSVSVFKNGYYIADKYEKTIDSSENINDIILFELKEIDPLNYSLYKITING
jgi:hypothetical protein